MKIISVVGARPNFMKVAPVYRSFKLYKENNSDICIDHKICHTGQHYDKYMSDIFFKDLELPEPDFYLGVGSGSHAEQTAKIMIEFEKVLLNEKPDIIIVYGDVNSTIACSLTAVKMGIKIAHVEAGLRSFDKTMPEEINRILTDAISDYLFVTEPSAIINLKNEGKSEKNIFFVGHVMIDNLINHLPKIEKSNIIDELNLSNQEYIVVTLHRPSNVDNKERLEELIIFLLNISKQRKIVFPIHPRTEKNLKNFGLYENLKSENIILTQPIGYIDFVKLVKNSLCVITDSGGIQEETTYLKIPCITLRESTERPITVDVGTNYLVGNNLNLCREILNKILNGDIKKSRIPDLWDGKASERIVNTLINKEIKKV